MIPAKEDLKPDTELIDGGDRQPPEIDSCRRSTWKARRSAPTGTRSDLLPTLTAFADVNNNGAGGRPTRCVRAVPLVHSAAVLRGRRGELSLAQIFGRDFPNYSAGFSLNIPFRNRAAQGDYVDDMLQLRQTELQYQKAVNEVRVQVRNAVIGLQQARARYENAVATRVLAEQTLEAEQMRFKFGAIDHSDGGAGAARPGDRPDA